MQRANRLSSRAERGTFAAQERSLAFGALCAWVASRETLPQAWARVIFAADIAWVAGSALVLLLPASWTTAGIAGIVVVALVVADLAVLEYLGLRRLNAAH